MDPRNPYHGRGATFNPANRFEAFSIHRDPEDESPEDPAPGTIFLRDAARSIISWNDSPDLGFAAGVNPYRGCEHGCVYCYARPTHEYAGFSAGLDFETKILVKKDAPALLRKALSSPRWKPQGVMMSGVTDGYQPVERRLKLARGCLEVFAEFRNPVSLITKNALITRDIDVLQELARFEAVSVAISVTTLESGLASKMEPRTSHPLARIETIRRLAKAGIPVGVNVAPVIPGLTDHEMPRILKRCADAGARFAGFELLRLPHAVKDLFVNWLEAHFPERKEKVLGRIRETRAGELSDSRFGSRLRGEGVYARHIEGLFLVARRQAGFPNEGPALSTAHFRRSPGPQLAFELGGPPHPARSPREREDLRPDSPVSPTKK